MNGLKTCFILIAIVFSTKISGQVSINGQYRSGAGFYASSEAGLKLHLKKSYIAVRGLKSTDFGNASRSDSSSYGISIGAGSSFLIISKICAGAEINLRINDLNGNNGDPFLSPQLYLGYDFRWFVIQLNLGLPYFFGLGFNIPLKT